MQGLQQSVLLAFADHLTPAEVLGVLLERRQLRQGVIPHQELGQGDFGRVVEHFRQQAAQAPTFGGKCFADQLLQGGVAWPDDLVLVEPDDQLGGHESRRASNCGRLTSLPDALSLKARSTLALSSWRSGRTRF